jgi:tetratricopeptide (TPR) repeat protein
MLTPLARLLGTAETVLLCGSGVSAVEPSSVPTWPGLNSAVLDGVKSLALKSVISAPDIRDAVLSLHADDIPIGTFSQVLSDAFAGRFWMGVLTVLDGDVTNPVHEAIAESVRDGSTCRGVITTNFDTLIERACREAGFEVTVVVPRSAPGPAFFEEGPTGGARPVLCKIHGTASDPGSMVDLQIDKSKGLDPSIQSLIASACHDRHLVVLGFSGEDFSSDPDYLGLFRNKALPRQVTWVRRPGSALHPAARHFLDTVAARGVAVASPEVDLLDLAGAPAPEPHAAGSADSRLQAHVGSWLDSQMTFPPTAAVILAELLRLRGDRDAAASARTEIRRALSGMKVNIIGMLGAAATWSLLGKEERDTERALADMRNAEALLNQFDQIASSEGLQSKGPAIDEQFLMRAAIRQNAARVQLLAGNPEAASRFLDAAVEVLGYVRGPERARRLGGIWHLRGLLDLVFYRLPSALTAFETSLACATASGDEWQSSGSLLWLAFCLRASGDWELADLTDERATTLATGSADAGLRQVADQVRAQGTSIVASGQFADLITTIEPAPPWDELPAARTAGDRQRIETALAANVERDLKENAGRRLGQTLLSLALATEDTKPGSRFAETVHAMCTANLPAIPDDARFMLSVTQLGLNAASSPTALAPDLLSELMNLGRTARYQPEKIFAPQEFRTGRMILGNAAAQAGDEESRQQHYQQAEQLYDLAYRSLWLESAYDDAAHAALKRFDALTALGRNDDARRCLDDIRDYASRNLPGPYSTRHLTELSNTSSH